MLLESVHLHPPGSGRSRYRHRSRVSANNLCHFPRLFSTQFYMHSVLNNPNFGGLQYIVTGHGLATSQISFSFLFSRFSGPRIYQGIRTPLMLLNVTLVLDAPNAPRTTQGPASQDRPIWLAIMGKQYFLLLVSICSCNYRLAAREAVLTHSHVSALPLRSMYIRKDTDRRLLPVRHYRA